MLSFIFLLTGVPLVGALNNGIGRTPGMGWNSDYCTACHKPGDQFSGFQYESFVMYIADCMVSTGLKSKGYQYVNMDASWNTGSRDSYGDLVPDPKLWPHGIKYTIDYVHKQGLGFGLYGDRGDKDCAHNPGQEGHTTQDAQFFAKLEIDWFKEDSCSASGDHDVAFNQYGKMRDALNATGRPVWFALCGWNTWYAPVGRSLGNSWRIGRDTVCGWECVMSNIQGDMDLGQYAGPTSGGGGWNDMSLLLNPGMGTGSSLMSKERSQSQFGLYCVMASNLLMTGNLSALDPFILGTWGNEEAIAINQDPLGLAHKRLDSGGAVWVSKEVAALERAVLQECGGEPELQTWNLGAPFAAFLHNNKSNTCLNVADCKTELIYDGCRHTGSTCADFKNEEWEFTSDNHIKSFLSDKNCVTADAQHHLSLAPCDNSTTQYFEYDKQTMRVRSKDGLCLTAPGQPAANGTFIIGRPLTAGRWGVIFLNNNAKSVKVTCGADCFSKMTFTAGETLKVRDVWAKQDAGTTPATSFSPLVGGMGASRLFVLSKA